MTTPDARWAPETEDIALAALWKFGHLGQPISSDDEPAAIAWTRSAGRSVIAALADAGLLVTPELAALREAARAFRHCGADRGAFTTTLVALDAAVDAEARTTGGGT